MPAEDGASIRFSLVLATVGRIEKPGRFLASLRDQTYDNFELIVVDQNPDDRLSRVLKPYEDEFPIFHVKTKSMGLSRARNLGMKYVGGDVIAFPDDDCQYPRDLLSRVAHDFLRHPELDGLTGRSVDEKGVTSGGRFAAKPSPVGKLNVWGRNISYAIFVRAWSVRGLHFDERLGVGAGTVWGSGEETDYLLRLLERGAKLHYDPDLTVVHHQTVPPYDAGARRKAYTYGCGMGYLLRRYGFPQRVRAMRLARPLVGVMLSAAALKVDKAGYHWNTFRGRLRGLGVRARKTSTCPSPKMLPDRTPGRSSRRIFPTWKGR